MMIENLESRRLCSVTPAAPSPVPVPYPNTTEEAVVETTTTTQSKTSLNDFHFVKKIDKASPVLF
jgi:hypothetical protein